MKMEYHRDRYNNNEKLRKIAAEGFGDIEKVYGGGRQLGQRYIYNIEKKEGNNSNINNREAAAMYGGINIVSYTTYPNSHTRRWGWDYSF